jgi:hypothetical protein
MKNEAPHGNANRQSSGTVGTLKPCLIEVGPLDMGLACVSINPGLFI